MLLGMIGKEARLEGDGPYQDQSSLVQAVVSHSGPIDLVAQYQSGVLREVCSRFMAGPPEVDRAAACIEESVALRNRSARKMLLLYC